MPPTTNPPRSPSQGSAAGSYHLLLLRVVNPLETLSKLARPLRFSNATQGSDGWLDLGSFSVSAQP